MKNFRLLTAVAVSALLIAPSFAQDNASSAALAPGKPAGIHKADISTSMIYGIGILTLIAAGAIVIVNNEGTAKSSTTSTSP